MKLFPIIFVLSLSACSENAKELHFSALPDGLKDCKFYVIQNSEGYEMRVARCPNSQTSVTYHEAKTTHNNVVIE
jgi:hypothetical protein